jgi:hypothetical protein
VGGGGGVVLRGGSCVVSPFPFPNVYSELYVHRWEKTSIVDEGYTGNRLVNCMYTGGKRHRL